MSLFGLSSIVPAGLTAIAAGAADKLADGFSFAETLLRGEQAAETSDSSEDDQAAVEQAQAALATKLDEFRQRLTERLAAAGVDLSSPLTLQDDGFGYITVDGNHPDRAAIERLLAADAELTAAFNALAEEYAGSKSAGESATASSFDSDEPTPYDRLLKEIDRRGFRLTLQGERLTIDV